MSTRRLLLLRHGKSAWPAGVADQDRPLTGRGRKDATRVGTVVGSGGREPDYVVVSPSVRTRETWQRFQQGLRTEPQVSTDPRIYANSVDDVLAVIHETPDEFETLLLIGHNPSTAALVDLLDPDPPEAVADELAGGYPTAALTVFDVGLPWADVREGTGRLVDVVLPRNLR